MPPYYSCTQRAWPKSRGDVLLTPNPHRTFNCAGWPLPEFITLRPSPPSQQFQLVHRNNLFTLLSVVHVAFLPPHSKVDIYSLHSNAKGKRASPEPEFLKLKPSSELISTAREKWERLLSRPLTQTSQCCFISIVTVLPSPSHHHNPYPSLSPSLT